jgi:hypothetical protein
MSKTWMFLSSVQGRIYSVPRTVPPYLFLHPNTQVSQIRGTLTSLLVNKGRNTSQAC